MNTRYENFLKTLCPVLYKDDSYYIEIEEGWINLIINYSLKLEKLSFIQKNSKVRLDLIKEKFGKCVVYLDYATDEMDKLMNELEKESATICEKCGDSSDSVECAGPGWFKTLCADCRLSKA